jgi:hypothetical protein
MEHEAALLNAKTSEQGSHRLSAVGKAMHKAR